MTFKAMSFAFLVATVATLLTGCSSENTGDSKSTSIDRSTGFLDISLTDAPVDGALKVVVAVTGVEIKPENSESFYCSIYKKTCSNISSLTEETKKNFKKIDLLELQGTQSTQLLEGIELPSGQYQWIRLHIATEKDKPDLSGSETDDSSAYLTYIKLDNNGSEYPLYIPSNTGLKLHNPFSVTTDRLTDLTIDFDVRKSIKYIKGKGSYMLVPSLRLVDNTKTGTIKGTVDQTLLADKDCSSQETTGRGSAVYLYQQDTAPDDVGSKDEPVTSALVRLNEATGFFEYTLGYVMAGHYTAAFTCQASEDDPDRDDSIDFIDPQNVRVKAGNTQTVNFPAA